MIIPKDEVPELDINEKLAAYDAKQRWDAGVQAYTLVPPNYNDKSVWEDFLPIIHAHYDVIQYMSGPVDIYTREDGYCKLIEAISYKLGDSKKSAIHALKQMLKERPERDYYLSFYTVFAQQGCSFNSIKAAFGDNRYLSKAKYPEPDCTIYTIRCNFTHREEKFFPIKEYVKPVQEFIQP